VTEPDDTGQDVLAVDGELLAALSRALPHAELPPALRGRIMASARPERRLAHHAADVATLLDQDQGRAGELLARLDVPGSWTPGAIEGVLVAPVSAGPEVAGALAMFMRVAAGSRFPEHEHLGDEHVLVLQGRCIDSGSGRTIGPGERVLMTAGTRHAFDVCDGPDLLQLVVIHVGVRFGERVLRAPSRR
jgi:quercetin dioxygenase-like cupin family protein